MNLWRLELLRLYRTHRVWILLGIFAFFGALGPLTARYLPEIVDRLGAGAEVAIPEATPELAMAQYSGNAVQIGLLAIAFVAAVSLAFDAKLEMAVFLRTRASIRSILTPRYVVNIGVAAASLFVGSVVAFVGSAILISTPNIGGTIIGSLLLALYLGFAVAVAGFFASIVRSVPGTALLTLGFLIVIGLVGLIPVITPWLPSELVGAFDSQVAGGDFVYWRSIGSTIVLSAAAIVASVVLMERREI